MKVNGKAFRTLWLKPENEEIVQIIDQRSLPHEFIIEDLHTAADMEYAIRDMHVRGAVLIGVAGAYGMYLAALQAPDGAEFYEWMHHAAGRLEGCRPTAVNLAWAVHRQLAILDKDSGKSANIKRLKTEAARICESEVDNTRLIGTHGLDIIKTLSARKNGEVVNILTHCNAGWLACIDYGTATAPIYAAHDSGIAVHVWVDETRPRNQGAHLTAWELGQHGVAHTVIADNTGGHLMQHGLVDLVLVGSDRTTYTGDVANKIGTYLKALAAQDNGIPFYVALPSSTIDWNIRDGVKDIPIEERDEDEVRTVSGIRGGVVQTVNIMPENSPAANYAFDVTPARLVSGLICERGVCAAHEQAILELFPERRQ